MGSQKSFMHILIMNIVHVIDKKFSNSMLEITWQVNGV